MRAYSFALPTTGYGNSFSAVASTSATTIAPTTTKHRLKTFAESTLLASVYITDSTFIPWQSICYLLGSNGIGERCWLIVWAMPAQCAHMLNVCVSLNFRQKCISFEALNNFIVEKPHLVFVLLFNFSRILICPGNAHADTHFRHISAATATTLVRAHCTQWNLQQQIHLCDDDDDFQVLNFNCT